MSSPPIFANRTCRENLNQKKPAARRRRWATSGAEAALLHRHRRLLFKPIYTGCALRTTTGTPVGPRAQLRCRRLWGCQRRWSSTEPSRCTQASTSRGTPCDWSPMMTAVASYSPSPSTPTPPEGPSPSASILSPFPALVYPSLVLGILVSLILVS